MHKTNNRGFPVLDRKLKGIGRIKRTFGTDDPDTIKGISVMVTTLFQNGDFQFLEGVRDGKLSLLEVYAKWKRQDLKNVPTVESVLPFDPTVFDWLDSYTDIKDGTREDYKHNYKQLLGMKKSFTLEELPTVLSDYRKRCVKNKTHRQFNVTRNSVRSFLKNYLNQFHPIYQAVVVIKPLNDKPKRTEKAWSVQDIVKVTSQLTPPVANQVWTMVTYGCGMTEYENGLTVEGDGIRIKGTKMARIDDRRNRLVPFINQPTPLAVKVKRFRGHLNKASGGTMQPYDLRRTYAAWCLEAGIPFDRVQQYMGHAPKSMTERYARSTVAQWLKDDGVKLKTWIDAQKTKKVNKMASKFFE